MRFNLKTLLTCRHEFSSNQKGLASTVISFDSLAEVNYQTSTFSTNRSILKMLPPIEESMLQSNPKFAALHTMLANNILNPSGSTKKQAAQKERDAVSDVRWNPSLCLNSSLMS